ncbi:MAG: DoxX family protein [Streptosporangiales bacterium]|nr:DoxX family protein [Streptosporangiales bacterium]
MTIAYVLVTLVAVAANAFSGFAAMTRFRPVMATLGPAMERTGIPESWLAFPIGTLKAAGAAGLLLGLLGVPLIGPAAAAGLILYYVCAAFTHLRVADYSPQFYLAIGFFLPLAVAALALDPALTALTA